MLMDDVQKQLEMSEMTTLVSWCSVLASMMSY